ncbi:hypothetical protein Fcan01_15090 [Folsomia candida]|uniref:Uncharacterized protein n=2 Tax=Folsomia candida TaxID=158441 RepID=A0A226DX13_FOLCA|nr:hypothetical protein Fcan01_15090 [Folsomia candida]
MSEPSLSTSSESLASLLELRYDDPSSSSPPRSPITLEPIILQNLPPRVTTPIFRNSFFYNHAMFTGDPSAKSVSSSGCGGEDLSWDINGNWGLTKSNNYSPSWGDEDAKNSYKDFWSVEVLDFEKDPNFKHIQSNSNNINQPCSIFSSICACFLYSLAECFLG